LGHFQKIILVIFLATYNLRNHSQITDFPSKYKELKNYLLSKIFEETKNIFFKRGIPLGRAIEMA